MTIIQCLFATWLGLAAWSTEHTSANAVNVCDGIESNMILHRLPFPWLFPLIDRCLVQTVRARLVLEDPWLEMVAVQEIHDLLRAADWTEEEFTRELLRRIDQDWDSPPFSGGRVVPILGPGKVRLAA